MTQQSFLQAIFSNFDCLFGRGSGCQGLRLAIMQRGLQRCCQATAATFKDNRTHYALILISLPVISGRPVDNSSDVETQGEEDYDVPRRKKISHKPDGSEIFW